MWETSGPKQFVKVYLGLPSYGNTRISAAVALALVPVHCTVWNEIWKISKRVQESHWMTFA